MNAAGFANIPKQVRIHERYCHKRLKYKILRIQIQGDVVAFGIEECRFHSHQSENEQIEIGTVCVIRNQS